MRRSTVLLALAFLAAAGGLHAQETQPATQPTVTVDPSVTHQTIRAWGGTGGWLKAPEFLRRQVIETLVDDLGLTRLRWEPPRHEWEYPFNDNDDPKAFNWDAFKSAEGDRAAREWIVPFKQRVEARGEKFDLYVSPSFFQGGSSGVAPAWMDKPEEYAEWALAFLLHIRKTYQIEADFYCVCNEAGNGNAFSPPVVAAAIKALGPRLKAEGLKTKIEFPECVNADQSWNYMTRTQDDAEMWQYVGVVTYHLYGPLKQRPQIRDFARARGLPTGQTEFMGTTIWHLFDDLIEGGVSYWEHYGLAGPGGGNGTYLHTRLSGGSFTHYVQYWNFRQVMHYVRPGAVRVDSRGDDPRVGSLAFVKDRRMTVVLLSRKGREDGPVVIRALPPGKYGVSVASTGPFRELGIRQVGPDGTLQVALPRAGTLTVYPYAGGNLPPTITQWEARPDFLTAPKGETTLSASATDPEGDNLSYAWEVRRQPAGAKAVLADPRAAKTAVANMSAPGEYVFAVTVGDGSAKTVREVMVPVFEKNQPPQVNDLHNRLPVLVVLPQTRTELRGGAHDLEGDKVSLKWSLLKQPEGAQAVLETPQSGQCKVAGLTVAGDYVFRLQADDGHNTVSQDLTVTVHPQGRLNWPGTK